MKVTLTRDGRDRVSEALVLLAIYIIGHGDFASVGDDTVGKIRMCLKSLATFIPFHVPSIVDVEMALNKLETAGLLENGG